MIKKSFTPICILPTDIFPHPPPRPNTTPQDPRGRKHSRLKTNRIPEDWGGAASGGGRGDGQQHPSITTTITTYRKDGTYPGRIKFRQRSGMNGSTSAGNSLSGGIKGIGCLSRPFPPALCHVFAFLLLMVMKPLSLE